MRIKKKKYHISQKYLLNNITVLYAAGSSKQTRKFKNFFLNLSKYRLKPTNTSKKKPGYFTTKYNK